MSDGGDGFGAILNDCLEAERRKITTVDAAHRPVKTEWSWEPKRKIAVVDTARVVGLAMLPPGKFHPFELDTFGLGKVLRAAQRRGARRCLVGIGGSATNDAGFGMARALGWKFRDQSGAEIIEWPDLCRLREIEAPEPRKLFHEVVVAVDVENPLNGKLGCTRVYGPQKGMRPGDYARADAALERLAHVALKFFGKDFAQVRGAGAAGGLGFGLLAFTGARAESGFDIFARASGLEKHLRKADVVLTGEGAIDDQTLMGKGVGRVARLCRENETPCLGLAGVVTEPKRARRLFTDARGLTELTTVDQAKSQPARWLEALAAQVARDFRI